MSDDLFSIEENAAPERPHRPVVISPKRHVILQRLRSQPSITLAEAVELIGGNIYANKNFHVGNVLSAMVKAGLIKRVKRGTFSL